MPPRNRHDDPLRRLEELVSEWPDSDGDRISVVINQPLPPPPAPPKSSIFLSLSPKLKPAISVAVIIGAAVAGAVVTIIEWFRS